MPSTAALAGTDRLLHGSPERVVLERSDPLHGGAVVVKLFLAGALADAEREFSFGRQAAGPGVVEHLAVGTDSASHRPCVTLRLLPGEDLDRLVAARGALPAAPACALMAEVATTLARLHALRSEPLPAGMVHGDVKPKNLLTHGGACWLLDFEHASAVAVGAAPRPRPGSERGTLGFAAPELQHGAAAHPAQDVYSLGATLRWLLDGGNTPLPQAPGLQALIERCLARTPSSRPSAAELAAALQQWAHQLADDPDEATLADWATGSCRTPPAASNLRHHLPWHRRQALLRRRPRLLEPPGTVPQGPEPLRTALRQTQSVLRRFPRAATALQWRQTLREQAELTLGTAARTSAAHIRSESFAAGHEWLVAAEHLHAMLRTLPGGCLPRNDDPTTPTGLWQRDPGALLARLRQQLDAARQQLADAAADITSAESRLDLRAAEAAIERMAGQYGGASPTVTRRRDQLHRLTFYLDRVARAATPFERTAPLWPAAALTPLGALITAAGDALRHRTAGTNDSSAGGGSVGWRSLQLTLANLAEEFPHLTGPRPALAALSDALAQLTDQAWQLLTEGQQRLHVAPVPVRPLQLTLGRLDTLRNLEVFVDRPERPRSALLDGIEALRLAFEQARATRDRLTASAEHALARGHWTTGLFDMERAVAGLRADDDQDRAQAAQLQERLATARKQKQEIEAATRRNVELTTQYVTLQDDSTSTFAARLQVLGERRDVLLYLGMYVTADRASLYRQDLRDVETQIALEHAAFAEHQLDGSTDPLARAALARTTLARLTESMTGNEHGLSPSGRLVRVHEHWRTLAERCQQTLDDLATSQRARQRQRHRIAAIAVLAVVTTAAAIAVAVQSWLRPPPAMAATRDGR